MPIATTAPAPKPKSLSTEAQASALWTFVQAKATRFTLNAAVEVLNSLDLQPDDTPKLLTRRLIRSLKSHGIAMKHTIALEAAARLLTNDSWHSAEHAAASLRFSTFDSVFDKDGLDKDMGNSLSGLRVHEFVAWSDLAVEMRTWTDRLIAKGLLPLGVLSLQFTGSSLTFAAPVAPLDDPQRPQRMPLGMVTSIDSDPNWLEDSTAALEKLRRYLEESSRAVLDGFAVLQLCATSTNQGSDLMAVGLMDVANSELVLLREEEHDYEGFEIARGDELTCFYQLELSLRDFETGSMPELSITVPEEGAGAWIVNGVRYVWALDTLKPQEVYPGRIHRQLSIWDCERMLRRYHKARRILGQGFSHPAMVKPIEYLGGPPEVYRVDLHWMLNRLQEAGLTWETYCEEHGAPVDAEGNVLPMQDRLPVGFVFQFLQNLKAEKPNEVFAKPNMSEMVRVDDDSLLRALLPRVQHVQFVMRSVYEAKREDLLKVLHELGDGMRLRVLVSGGALTMEKSELPHQVYAADAEQFRASVEELGLTLYAAVMPHLMSTDGLVPKSESVDTWPWALGNAIFFRFLERD